MNTDGEILALHSEGEGEAAKADALADQYAPREGDLARARVLAEIFRPHYEFWSVDVKQKNGTMLHGRVLAGSAEEAAHRVAIAGEVVSIELAPS